MVKNENAFSAGISWDDGDRERREEGGWKTGVYRGRRRQKGGFRQVDAALLSVKLSALTVYSSKLF